MRALHLAVAVAIAALAACTEEKAPGPVAATPADGGPGAQTLPAPQSVTAEINWDAAKADLAKRPSDIVVPQSVGDGALVVPMLLPGGIVQTASDRPTPPRITSDGYFATYHMPRYDVIVNGSQKAYAAGGAAAPTGSKETMKFQTVEAGAQLVFSRYGADYVIEFECRQVDSPEGCISEAEAKEFADTLFVAQSR